MSRHTIALAQINPALGDLERNLALHEKTAEEAIRRGASLLVFPELSLTGYFLKDLVSSVALPMTSPILGRLRDLSQRIDLVVGLVEESSEHLFYNAAIYLSMGEIQHVHRKVYLPTYGIFDEQRYLAEGGQIRTFRARVGRSAILICEDMWHPSAAYVASIDGMEILISPSASPGRGGLEEGKSFANARAWETINRAYAQLFTCYVLFANRVGYEDGACFWGGSEVITPSGEPVAKAEYLSEEILVVEIDPAEVRRARTVNPLLRDERLDVTLRELERVRREGVR
ncbi:carbon-nitrogen hydrolase [Candidatus Methylomirabilis limnetica]|uniref:Carbon-nitrogen hydrolase n=1 Tax=Candidatus Methylomirabilis limnetica TaxID=2033718 RepID=A0A2T4U1L9_9BACT|nr:nitrilase-related carbon-nitrogen hydrolase [Candidatus Methylomirabilis limnetica]PTL37254.1 carbon-nitrogen hydrolase [Candidatus Methylomirabilis limnetica]